MARRFAGLPPKSAAECQKQRTVTHRCARIPGWILCVFRGKPTTHSDFRRPPFRQLPTTPRARRGRKPHTPLGGERRPLPERLCGLGWPARRQGSEVPMGGEDGGGRIRRNGDRIPSEWVVGFWSANAATTTCEHREQPRPRWIRVRKEVSASKPDRKPLRSSLEVRWASADFMLALARRQFMLGSAAPPGSCELAARNPKSSP